MSESEINGILLVSAATGFCVVIGCCQVGIAGGFAWAIGLVAFATMATICEWTAKRL